MFRTLARHFPKTSPLRLSRNYTMSEKPLIFAPPTYQYEQGSLSEADVNPDPYLQFHQWFQDARHTLPENLFTIPESSIFLTARLPLGRVSSRVVLLKELDHAGFVVYSNWDTSKKAKDYASNKHAALTFFWPHNQRQVRVEGVMEMVGRDVSERYFQTRPRGSKIGAWASPQSLAIASRDVLDQLYRQYEEKFKDVPDAEIPCPELWGGVRVVPLEIEFWQGGVSRLHDRITFTRDSADQDWTVTRISP